MADDDAVPEDMTVTQTGAVQIRRRGQIRVEQAFSFRSSLRTDTNETYMSVISDRLAVETAVPLVCRGDSAGSADAVRYAVVEDLTERGFTVTYKTSRTVPGHIAVTWPGEWNDDVMMRFEACFREFAKGPGS